MAFWGWKKVIKQKAAGKYKLRMQEEVIQERGNEEEEELKSRARKPSLSERICARLVYATPQCFLQVDVVGGKQLFQMKLHKRYIVPHWKSLTGILAHHRNCHREALSDQ